VTLQSLPSKLIKLRLMNSKLIITNVSHIKTSALLYTQMCHFLRILRISSTALSVTVYHQTPNTALSSTKRTCQSFITHLATGMSAWQTQIKMGWSSLVKRLQNASTCTMNIKLRNASRSMRPNSEEPFSLGLMETQQLELMPTTALMVIQLCHLRTKKLSFSNRF
jgi:hypothetical protein